MKKTWDGFLVGPDQWSPKEPQLMRKPTPVDPQALKDPRPDQANDNNFLPSTLMSEMVFLVHNCKLLQYPVVLASWR
jgi:hypothetical protein